MIRFVTTNAGKFREVAALLQAQGVAVVREDRATPELQADSLAEVVAHSVRAVAADLPGDFFLDDSGLFVDALGGFPGVYSSYAFRTIGNAGILRLLEEVQDRRARFETVVGLRLHAHDYVFKGECHGTIAPEPRGAGGFGFDPIFVPNGHDRTFAEMAVEEKNAVSHRGAAAKKLVAHLKGR